jgi:hypothetical protein
MAIRKTKGADADDDSIRDADERALEELREAEKPEPREREEVDDDEPDDGPLVLDSDDPEPQPKPSRAERRAERGRIREENEQLRQQLAATNQQIQQLAALQAQARQPAEPQVDPEVARLEQENQQAWDEQQRISADYAARSAAYQQRGQAMPLDEERGFHQRAQAAELQRNKIASILAYREAGLGQQQAPQQPTINPYVAHVNMQYQDVLSDPRAKAYARAIGEDYAARGEMNIQRYEETLKEARKVFLAKGGGNGAPRRPAPTPESRAKYAGQGAGSGGGGGESRPVIRISEAEKRMANAAFPHIKDDKKRYSKWVQDQGPEWMNERAGRGSRADT